MNISGLVYNNSEAGVSSATPNRGVMAPQHVDGHHYVQMQQHGEFSNEYTHQQGYYESPQYEMSGYPHNNQYHGALRHPQPVVQHQQVQQQASQQQPHHAQHMHMQQNNQTANGRSAPIQSVQRVQQVHQIQVSGPPSQDMMSQTRTARPVARPAVQNQQAPQSTRQMNQYGGYSQAAAPQQALQQQQSQYQQQQQQQHHHQHKPQQQQVSQPSHGQQGVHQHTQQHNQGQQLPHQVQIQRQQNQIQQQQMQQQQQQQQAQRAPQQAPMPSPSQTHSSPQQAPAQTPQASSSPSLTTPKLGTGVDFKTDVDTLMKAIQSKQPNTPTVKSPEVSTYGIKTQQLTPNTPGFPVNAMRSPYGNQYGTQQFAQPAVQMGRIEQKVVMTDINVLGVKDEVNGKRAQKPRKRYECTFPACSKSFFQKTHLEIHTRAHSGDKPYTCSEPGCGQKFSQMGNLKTHQRRHTGEKPFICEQCGKRFAQRGNVRAHRIVHEGAKPFICRLESCGKQFTQLGNLKSHQNKFHAQTIRTLTDKFATLPDVTRMTQADRSLFEYFADLYKNSNRGIKGRGKDRKILSAASGQKSSGQGGRTLSTSSASGNGMHTSTHEASMSPSSGSSTSSHHDHGPHGSGNNQQYGDYSGHDMDDDSSVNGSPFEPHHPQPHQTQQQLPPLRVHAQSHLNQGMMPMTMVPPPQYAHQGGMERRLM